MKVVIMAGGRGTRISSMIDEIPKPMIPIAGKPVLEHEIECLKKAGMNDIIITVGYLRNVIMDYFGDGTNISPVTKKSFGVHIEYFIENEPLGNAGALFQIKDKLQEDFLLINADSLFNVYFEKFIHFHNEKGGLVTLFTHPNTHPYDSGLIVTDRNASVSSWLTKEDKRDDYYQNLVNAGLHIISPQILEQKIDKKKIDLDRDLLKPLAGTGKMYAYHSSEYVKDMGTPERFRAVSEDLENGIIQAKNLSNKQKAIFLDRDGTINKHIGFLKNIDIFELLPRVTDAIRLINNSGYLAIVITNQPVIARGEVTVEELRRIHNKMETLLGEDGAYIDDIYYCPHHPDKGFEGEIIEYKIECECRKPKPGLILKAAQDYNIDLEKSWMIGDSARDVGVGRNAGCRSIYIGEDSTITADEKARDLFEAVKKILNQ